MSPKPMLIAAMMLLCSRSALAAFTPGTQEGSKLVGTGAVGAAYQGKCVALSSDGNTAAVGGDLDNSNQGAVWIYTRTNGVWSQQGTKLVGTGGVGNSYQGHAVALSADGNTLIEGGYGDNGAIGAAWVFTRSGAVWTQEGSKLVGTGGAVTPEQGWSIALSSDGNTAAVGGYGDNSSSGAVWVFTRSAGVWTQQGSKLVGTGATGAAGFGSGVALSTDGNTLLIGGQYDNTYTGAAWVFTRSVGIWTQQGSKLVGTGAASPGWQGCSVALSSDGNTAMVGSWADNSYLGAAWVYTRAGGFWSQQGGKLVGTGSVGTDVEQGSCVRLSSDGNTALVGGSYDATGVGATWVYSRGPGGWSQHGSKLLGTGNSGPGYQGGSIAVSADGSTALIGGNYDAVGTGAVWAFLDPTVLAAQPGAVASFIELAAPFPNPASHELSATFSLPRATHVTLGVYDLTGRSVRTLLSETTGAGEHTVRWNGLTSAGRAAPGGVYFLTLRAGGDQLTRRFALLR